MAENKQYIIREQEYGTVMISEEVVAAIVTNAAKDVEGVASLGTDSLAKKALGKGLKITISETNEITIECNLFVCYGSTVVEVAKAVQDTVCAAVESMTGVRPAVVNVNVCGIARQ